VLYLLQCIREENGELASSSQWPHDCQFWFSWFLFDICNYTQGHFQYGI